MTVLVYLVPIALALGALGLAAYLWRCAVASLMTWMAPQTDSLRRRLNARRRAARVRGGLPGWLSSYGSLLAWRT